MFKPNESSFNKVECINFTWAPAEANCTAGLLPRGKSRIFYLPIKQFKWTKYTVAFNKIATKRWNDSDRERSGSWNEPACTKSTQTKETRTPIPFRDTEHRLDAPLLNGVWDWISKHVAPNKKKKHGDNIKLLVMHVNLNNDKETVNHWMDWTGQSGIGLELSWYNLDDSLHNVSFWIVLTRCWQLLLATSIACSLFGI